MTIRLSILDQSIAGEAETPGETLRNTVELAKFAERIGYHRFWVAEHHASEEVVGPAPEILLSYLAAKTTTIQLASGGIMLQHYSPFKVAEQFHVLANLAPNRIALGIGKAPGGFQLATEALQAEFKAKKTSFEAKLAELLTFTRQDPRGKYADLQARPLPQEEVPVFLLGGSAESAVMAAKAGVGFVFAYFINGEETVLKEAREAYEANFTGNDAAKSFQLAAIIAISEQAEEAHAYVETRESVKIVLADGKRVNVGTKERAEAYLENVTQDYELIIQKAGVITGVKETVGKEIHRLAKAYQINDFLALTPIKNKTKKQQSYQWLKEAVEEEAHVRI